MAGDECCSPKNLLFSDTEAWRLYSPENRNSRSVAIFYVVWRWFWAIFFTFFIVLGGVIKQSWYLDDSQRIKWFIYLTNLAFLLFCISQIVNAITATVGYKKSRSGQGSDDTGAIRWYMKLNWVLYEMSGPPAIVITILFWAVLYNDEFKIESGTLIAHGLNGVFVMLIDIWVTAMPYKVLHFYLSLGFGAAIIIFSAIYTYAGGTNAMLEPYIYKFLDWHDNPKTAVTYSVVSLVMAVVVFFILFGLHKLRIYIYSKCLPTTSLPHNDQDGGVARYKSVELKDPAER